MRIFSLLVMVFFASASQANSIWQVSGDQEFYLFGTIHILKPDAYPLPPVYEQTLQQCAALWLEVDLKEMEDAQVMHQVQNLMLLPVGDQLKDQVSTVGYKKLEQMAAKAGISLGLLQGLKPWVVVNQLTLMIFQNKGFTGDGLDMYLHRAAEAKGLPVYGLETVLWQMNMFDHLGQKDQDSFIDFSTEDLANVEQLVDDMYGQWQAGDYETMYRAAKFDRYPEIEQVMLANRNLSWMETFKKPYHGTQCVAVGLLHMAGEHGLVQQFKQAGYQVKQLTD